MTMDHASLRHTLTAYVECQVGGYVHDPISSNIEESISTAIYLATDAMY